MELDSIKKIFLLILIINSLIQLSSQLENVKFNKNQIEFQNGILIEIESNKLKQTYPELATFLIENAESEKLESKKKDLLNANNFIYLNNKTNKYEGVSMHSSYSVIQLSENNIFTLVTSDNWNSKLKEPFYHQFVYSIKISHFNRNENRKDLVEILNEQSIEASRIRVSLVRKLSEILNLVPTHIRINWIEKSRINEEDFLKETLEDKLENKIYDEDDLEDDDADNEEFLSKEKDSDDNDYNYDVDTHIEPEFISEFSAERLRKLNANRKNQYLIVISFSDSRLLELQNEYYSIKRRTHTESLEQIKSKYETNCNEFFKSIKQKHLDALKANYKFLNIFEQNKQIEFLEKIKRVHLIKLCNLNELNNQTSDQKQSLNFTKSSILNSLFSPKLNNLIRNATEEINFFNNNNLDYLDQVNSNETTFIDDFQSNLLIQYKEENTNNNSSSKMSGEQNDNQSNMFELKYSIISNLTANDSFALNKNISQKNLIWSIIPEEDLFLAVIVPCVIIVSMTVMTIIVICLLQMYNNEKTNPHFRSINSSENSNLTNLTSDKHSYKVQTLHKEKAFLSKGVPVILYEEMSEKPMDDFDYTNKDTMDCTNFRSPSTFRNEKPPAPLTPAPPEYHRANPNVSSTANASYSEEKEPLFSNSYSDKKKNSTSIKNQIQQLNYILP